MVTCAVRLCDGCVILIDAIEGVCAQTEAVIRQALVEGIVPCLAINKIDRLYIDIGMSSKDAYYHIFSIIEQANALLASVTQEENVYNDDSIQFSPTKGNVIFSSGIMGWGFTLIEFAEKFHLKLKISKDSVLTALWGDYYFDSKSEAFVKDARIKEKDPAFVTFILNNIWTVFNSFLGLSNDREKQLRILKSIDENLIDRVNKMTNNKDKLVYVMKNWLPLSKSMVHMIINQLPPPSSLSEHRIERLLSSNIVKYENLPKESQDLKQSLMKCLGDNQSPTIIFIAKMIYYDEKDIWHACSKTSNIQPNGQNFVAFARIFSGNVKIGQQLYVLFPRFIAGNTEDTKNYQLITIMSLFVFYGRDIRSVEFVSAGNIFGIGGLDNIIFRSGTISSTLSSPAFSAINFNSNPLFSVSIEPSNLSDYDNLVKSFEMLGKLDPVLKITQSETGEHILSVIGEVHLTKSISDLRTFIGDIPLNISEPIVPFNETLCTFTNASYDFPSFVNSLTQPRDCTIHYKNDKFHVRSVDNMIHIVMSINLISQEYFDCTILATNSKVSLNTNEVVDLVNNKGSALSYNIKDLKDRIISVSSSESPCVLLDKTFSSFATPNSNANLYRALSIGFQIACQTGPLISAPMSGILFMIHQMEINETEVSLSQYCSDLVTAGQITTLIRIACHSCSILSRRMRLSVPVYQCIVRCNVKFLSSVYMVLNKRYARIVSETQIEGTSVFVIHSFITASESLRLTEEMNAKTGGNAQVQLHFDKWETILADPLMPESSEDLLSDGKIETILPIKVVKNYLISIRKRKGLKINEKIIEFSEKQRTIKRNK